MENSGAGILLIAHEGPREEVASLPVTKGQVSAFNDKISDLSASNRVAGRIKESELEARLRKANWQSDALGSPVARHEPLEDGRKLQ